MDNNQNERKNINLTKDGVREAYPVYNSAPSQGDLQRQEYRNNTESPFAEPEYGDQFNVPPVQPNAGNPPAPYSNNQFDHYYDYNDPVQNNQTPPQYGGYNGTYPQNQPAGGVRQTPPPVQQPQYNQQYGPGFAQQQATKFCKYCGQKIAHDAIVCTHCGRQVEELRGAAVNQPAGNGNINIYNAPFPNQMPYGATNVSRKSKTTALILAIIGLFGLSGLHRFYAGKGISGLIYLFTWGLFGIGTIYDIYKIASNTFTDSAGYLITDK